MPLLQQRMVVVVEVEGRSTAEAAAKATMASTGVPLEARMEALEVVEEEGAMADTIIHTITQVSRMPSFSHAPSHYTMAVSPPSADPLQRAHCDSLSGS